MNKKRLHQIITIFIAVVWCINSISKIFNLAPRHEAIVARILGASHSRTLTILIGIAELIMVLWIVLKFKPKFNAVVQIVIVLLMNIIEFTFAPDLLMWGKFNIIFALLFSYLVYYNQFKLSNA